MSRSRQRKCSIKKGALKNFVKFIGKQMCQSLFFDKVAGLGLKKEKILRTPILKNICHQLLPTFTIAMKVRKKNTIFLTIITRFLEH